MRFANAQSYSPAVYTSSGGSTWGGRTYPYNYGAYPFGFGGGGPQQCTCSGEITATFTWSPGPNGAQAPSSVIVEQKGYAAWNAESIPVTPQGACNDGLGDPAIPGVLFLNLPFLYPYMAWGTSQGVHYSAQTPSQGGSIILNCSPSANVNNDGASQAGVAYEASIVPVTINLAGTTVVNNQQEILPGQMCSASLSLPAGFICTHCTWSVSGTIHKQWLVTQTQNPPDSNSQLIDVPAAAWQWQNPNTPPTAVTPSSPSWYWDDTEGTQYETVSCSAAIIAPDGTMLQTTVTQTVDQKIPVNQDLEGFLGIEAVTNSFWHKPGLWVFCLENSNFPGYLSPDVGIVFQIRAGMPPSFMTGNIEMIQLVSVFITATTLAQPPQTIPLANDYGDDTVYPIYIALADGTKHLDDDSPDIALDNFYAKYSLKEDFVDYLMFLPPGAGSQWVPLRLMKWGWSDPPSITQPKDGWQNWPAGASPGQPYYLQQILTNGYPRWTHNVHFN